MDGYYDDQQSNYSDDFEEDDSDVRVAAKPPPLDLQATPKRATFKQPVKPVARTDPTTRKAKSHYITNRRASWKGKGSKGRAVSETKRLSSFMSSPRDRELSAKQHALRKTQNELSDAKRELDDMRKENRLLNRLQVRQEKQLNKIQTQEGELPQILARHAEEVRVLKEQVKRSQEVAQSYQHRLDDVRQEMLRINDRKKKLEEIARRRQLLERETLTVQLKKTQDNLREKETKLNELERGVEAMGKNHSQEVRILRQKNKSLSQENEVLRNTTQTIQTQLKDKEKEIEVLNIYSQRIGKRAVPRAPAPPTTETTPSQTDLSCPPSKLVSLQSKPPLKSSASQTDLPKEKPPPPRRRDSKITSTQTDIAVNPKNETLLVTLSPEAFQAGSDVPQQPVSVAAGIATQSSPQKKEEIKEPHKSAAPVVTDQDDQQKKELLLSKLRAMDGQKGPPASHPVPSTITKSSVEPTANVAVSSERPSVLAASRGTAAAVVPEIQKDSDTQKKKLLMAKLMAIDEGDNPNKVTVSSMDVRTSAVKPDVKKTSAVSSKSSLQSWPDTVENLYHGKPAFATEDDPFGSRHASGNKRATSHKREAEVQAATDTSNSQPSVHKPSFGRRVAGLANNKPRNGMIFGGLEDNTDTLHSDSTKPPPNPFTFENSTKRDYPWENKVDIASHTTSTTTTTHRERPNIGGGQSMLFGPTANPGSLLPLRPKAEASGLIGEPDDLEELVL